MSKELYERFMRVFYLLAQCDSDIAVEFAGVVELIIREEKTFFEVMTDDETDVDIKLALAYLEEQLKEGKDT